MITKDQKTAVISANAVHEGDTVAGEQLLVRLDVIVEETENQ